jgi:hypothetical protein
MNDILMQFWAFGNFFYRMRAILILMLPFLIISCDHEKILIVADEWPQMDALAARLEKFADCDIQKAEQDEMDFDLSEFDFVFMYVHKPIDQDAEKAFIDYTKGGGSLIVLHHGIASSKMQNPAWLEFLGIELYPRDHPEFPWGVIGQTTHTMVNLYPGHFITTNGIRYDKTIPFHSEYDTIFQGVYQAFDLPDTEIFLNQRLKDDQIKVLFGFISADGSRRQPTSGWYKQSGKGRIFYYQAGHSVTDFENPNFIRILLNSLEWQPDQQVDPLLFTYPNASGNQVMDLKLGFYQPGHPAASRCQFDIQGITFADYL